MYKHNKAAREIQKIFRGYRTRRKLNVNTMNARTAYRKSNAYLKRKDLPKSVMRKHHSFKNYFHKRKRWYDYAKIKSKLANTAAP